MSTLNGVETSPAYGLREDHALAVVRASADIAQALCADGWQLDCLLRLIARKACEVIGVQRCSVFLRQEHSELFVGKVGHAISGEKMDVEVSQLVAGIEADRFTQEIVRSGRPVLIRNARSDPRPVRATMRAWNIRTQLGVPLSAGGEVIGLLFLDDENVQHRFDDSVQALAMAFADFAAAVIVEARLRLKMRKTERAERDQNKFLRGVLKIERSLTELLLAGGGLLRFAREVARLAGRSCAILGADQECIAWAPGSGRTASPAPPWLTAPADCGLLVKASAEVTASSTPIVGPLATIGLSESVIVVPVSIRSEGAAHVLLFEDGTPFRKLDSLIARRAAALVAVAISIAPDPDQKRQDLGQAFFRELAVADANDVPLGRRAGLLGIDLTQAQRLLLFAPREPRSRPRPDVATISAAVADALGEAGPIAGAVPEGVIAIVPAEGPDGLERQLAEIEAAARDVGAGPGERRVLAVISEPLVGIDSLSEGMLGLRSLARGVASCVGTDVVAAESLGSEHLLLGAMPRRSRRKLVHEVLGPVLDPVARRAELLTTLQSLSRCAFSASRSAAELGVHVNTIRYRLARIVELLGVDLASDADAQFKVRLALSALSLADRRETEPAEAEPAQPGLYV